jgi:hypothetical protein
MNEVNPWVTVAAACLLTVARTANGQVIDNPFVKASPEIKAVIPREQSVSQADATPAIPRNKQELEQALRGQRAEYQQFQRSVERMISGGSEVAANDREWSDIRTLQWLSRDLQKHVDAGDWNRAADVKQRMQVAIQRSQVVVADAPRRKAEQERAEQERQHRELMAQRERQHKEDMAQRARQNQAIVNQLQYSSASRSSAPTYPVPIRPPTITNGHKSKHRGSSK